MAGGLTRWDPLAEITQLRNRFDRQLDELGGQDHGAWMPAIGVVRHGDGLVCAGGPARGVRRRGPPW